MCIRDRNIVRKFQQISKQLEIKFKILSDNGRGLGYARQLIVENANGEYICWVDSDNVVTADLIKNQVDFIRRRPSVGIAIPLILPTGKSLTERIQSYIWLIPTLNAMKRGRTPYITMEGAITPLRALREINGFDITIKGAGEDSNLVHRMKLKGYSIAVNPKAIIYHHMKGSLRDLLKHVAWYGRTQPNKSLKSLINEIMSRTLLYIKLTPLTAKIFRDIACILMPFYIVAWNIVYFISSIQARNYRGIKHEIRHS